MLKLNKITKTGNEEEGSLASSDTTISGWHEAPRFVPHCQSRCFMYALYYAALPTLVTLFGSTG